mgnify:CR=1 FL=1
MRKHIGELRQQPVQRLAGEIPQAELGESLHGRIDRRQPFIQRRLQARGQHAVLRVDHLTAERTGPDFPVAAQACAGHQVVLLGPGEVEEAQRELPRPVSEAHQQAPPAPVGHVGQRDLTLDHHPLPGPERPERDHAGPVLVALRQEEQEIDGALHAQPGQALGNGGSDAAEAQQAAGLRQPGPRPPRRLRRGAGKRPRWRHARGTAW